MFLTLAREGTLTTAARALGVSHPTVARRVQALEQQIGARLFERLPDRFVPTSAGEELLADTEAMEKAALSIHRRSAALSDTVSGVVRLSAGEAMAALIARHLPWLRARLRQIEFEVIASHTLANLSRREADLLIREQVPELAGIVARKLGRVAYAVYAARDFAGAAASAGAVEGCPGSASTTTTATCRASTGCTSGWAARGPRCAATTGWCCTRRRVPARASPCCPAISAIPTRRCSASAASSARSSPTSGCWSIATSAPCRACAPSWTPWSSSSSARSALLEGRS